jgi:hypothetical protein
MLSIQVKQVFVRILKEKDSTDFIASCVITFIGPPWAPIATIEMLSGALPKNMKQIMSEVNQYCKDQGAARVEWSRATGKRVEI